MKLRVREERGSVDFYPCISFGMHLAQIHLSLPWNLMGKRAVSLSVLLQEKHLTSPSSLSLVLFILFSLAPMCLSQVSFMSITLI